MSLIKFPSKDVLLLAKSIAKHTEGNYQDFIDFSKEVIESNGGPFGYDVELSFVIKDNTVRTAIINDRSLV